jgi:DNA-binding beta-propeller fold protein YncE
MNTTRPTADSATPRMRAAALMLTGLLLALAATSACKRQEKPAGGASSASAPAAAAGTPVPAADATPVIRDSAEPGKPAWAGLAEPRGVAVDAKGRLWVSDFGHSRVAIFDRSGGSLGGWGGVRGNGKFQMQDPADVAVHGEDVYVADTWNGRVQHLTTSGQFRDTSVEGLYGPRGVAVAADGKVWIADSGNNRMAIVQAGQPVRYVGKTGAGVDGLSSPVGVAISASGRVYVADIGNHRIQVLGADGKFERAIPVSAWTSPMEPYLAVDDRDNLFATVPAASAVLELDRSGKVLHTWSADDSGRKFLKPTGLALDAGNGVLYVVDTAASSVGTIHLAAKKP